MRDGQLIFCRTNPSDHQLVDIDLVEGNQVTHGQVSGQKLASWLQDNSQLTVRKGVAA